LFEEPIVIGDEAIYLGAQAYETIGTPHPLVAYAPATVPHSCIINQAKKSWEEYADRGTLLIAALIEDAAAPMMENTAYVQNTTHPQTVAPAADFEGGLYIHNFGSTPLNSFEIAMLGQGDEVPATRTITLPQPLGGRESTVITTLLHSGTAEGTAATWQATVSKFNGEAAQGGRPGLSTLYVTFDNFIRTPLIEEFTSQPCINCPQMAYFLEKALADYDQPYVYLAHHSGFADDGHLDRVIRLDNNGQIAGLADAELFEALIHIAGLQRDAVELSNADSVVDVVLFENFADGSVFGSVTSGAAIVSEEINFDHNVSP
jgi:hypothetical protein